MNNTIRRSTGMERCPYLGLHDDSSTSLAYPSTWNYCYRATPPASILVSHQVETCLCPQYVDCTVYLSNKWESLPSGLRARAGIGAWKNGSFRKPGLPILFFFLAAFVIVVIFLGQQLPFVPWTHDSIISTSSNHVAANSPLNQNGSGPQNGEVAKTPAISNISAGVASPIATQRSTTLLSTNIPPQTSGLLLTVSPEASQTLKQTSTPEGMCGHALDVPFGKNTRFVVHRVRRGENLNLYATQYQTSTNAILAVNYHLPMPVWEDWIIVIPVETTDVSRVPPFEPYQAIETRISLDDLAEQLNTDPQSLYKYNAFEGACKSFSGWLLIPRKQPTS